jgi:rRNA maturation protein Nop10
MRPAVFGRLVKVVLLVSLGFIGGLLVSGRAQDAHHGPVNVAVHLNGVQGSAAQFSTIPSAPEVTERKLNVGGEQQDEYRLLKSKKTTKSPTASPTFQATFPHGTASPNSERRLKAKKTKTNAPTAKHHHRKGTKSPQSERRLRFGDEVITLKRNSLRALKTSVDESFAPGEETYNPTPVQFHPTQKPNSERRQLKKSVDESFAPGKETYNPTPVQFHPTKKPSHHHKHKPTHKPTKVPTGTKSPQSERRELKKSSSVDESFAPGHETYAPTPENLLKSPTKKPNQERRALKFAPGKETYNPTPANLHPTKKPSSERRQLKKSVDESFAPGEETYNPTPVQFHPTQKPNSERRSLKAKKTTKSPSASPTFQATFPHGTASPTSEKKARILKVSTPVLSSLLSNEEIQKAAVASV